jgi:energy-coupling factor transporter ATP-binding protein EcfA2
MTDTDPIMRDDKAGGSDAGSEYARAAAHLDAVLARAELWPALAADRASLGAGIEAMRRMQSDLNGSLWMLLLGGTGVGKSTLMNALAGREIAPTSVVRPTTMRTTFYAHRDADLSPLSHVPPGAGELTSHEIEALRDKVVVDPPDFDSSVAANRKRLMPLLEASDLVITVVDREKYHDEELFKLLSRYRGEKSFIFIVNKLDRGLPDEVVDDLRKCLLSAGIETPRILKLSARVAFAHRRAGEGGGGEPGEFDELERIIQTELDAVRIREIKDVNLAGVASHLLDAFDRRIGADAPERIDAWLASCRRLGAETTDRLRRRFSSTVLEGSASGGGDALGAYLRSLQLLSFSGIFGLFMAASERLAAVLGRGWSQPVDEFEARALAQGRFRSVDEGSVEVEVSRAAAEAAAGLGEASLASDEARSHLASERTGLDARAVIEAGARGAGDALSALTAAARAAKWHNARNLLHNLLPTILVLAIPAYAGFALAAPFVGVERLLILGSIADGATLGIMLTLASCFGHSLLVQRGIRRGVSRALSEIEKGMGASVGQCLEERLVAPCERLARTARETLSRLDAARSCVESSTREEA